MFITPEFLVSTSAGIVSFLAFWVSIVTIRRDSAQKRIDNLVTLQAFLHRDEIGVARQAVREGKAGPSLQDPLVRRVCSSFDFAGMLVRNGAVQKAYFMDYWCISLLSLEKSLAAIADENTGEAVKIRDYYKEAYWLINEAKKLSHSQKHR